MARLDHGELPDCIRNQYKSKDIHKITKQSATMISVFLKDHSKINWRKKGQIWEIYSPSAD